MSRPLKVRNNILTKRELRKLSREFYLSPDLPKWIEFEDYKNMCIMYGIAVISYNDIMEYKEKYTMNCGYDEKLKCPIKSKSSIYHDYCKKDCKFFWIEKCPNCENILEEEWCCKLCGWTEKEEEEAARSRHIPKNIQNEVWRRDLGCCIQCSSKERLEFDHIIPFSKGGSNTARNIQLLCERCNREKRDII